MLKHISYSQDPTCSCVVLTSAFGRCHYDQPQQPTLPLAEVFCSEKPLIPLDDLTLRQLRFVRSAKLHHHRRYRSRALLCRFPLCISRSWSMVHSIRIGVVARKLPFAKPYSHRFSGLLASGPDPLWKVPIQPAITMINLCRYHLTKLGQYDNGLSRERKEL
jgi:hypothetical protein